MNIDDRHIPPQSIEAEMSILGAVFLENRSVETIEGIISDTDFYREGHRKIFRGMQILHDKSEPIDQVTLSEYLKKEDHLEEIGGSSYLAVLVDYVPTSANVAYYCRIVKEKAFERRILTGSQDAIGMIYSNTPVEQILEHLGNIANQLPQKGSDPVEAKHAVQVALKDIEKRHENRGKIFGIPYGIGDLDRATCGLSPGELIVIAGRPSMGKTALAGNIIESACIQDKTTLFFTLEMSRSNIIDRFIASHGNIKYQNIRSGDMQDSEWNRLTDTAAKLHSWKLFIDDSPGITLREIRSKAKRLKKQGLSLVVVDYLQLMALPGKDSRVQELGSISRGLKQLAREMEIPVVALSQLSRSVESRPDKRPLMSDLRDSGEIEQDADVILFPYRQTVYCPKCKDRINSEDHNLADHQAHAEIIIEKQRNGERNISIPVAWIGTFQRFAGLNEYSFQ